MTKQQLLKKYQPKTSDSAYAVMKKRYLHLGKDGEPKETVGEMYYRVAAALAEGEKPYLTSAEKKQGKKHLDAVTEKFYIPMAEGRMLPAGRILFEAGGTHTGQLANCFVVPIEDSMRGIFASLADAAEIQQKNGGTGFNFSKIRPKGDMVKNIPNVAAGPIHFLKTFDTALSRVLQGAKRHGGNMGILNVDHPDIEEFIELKDEGSSIKNFNISVGVTDDFMEKVREDADYDLINPRTGKAVKTLRAREVFDKIVERAWRCADPGVVFLDRIHDGNRTPNLGIMDATNPCGEQPLLPYESCNLAQVILVNHVKMSGKGKSAKPTIDYTSLEDTVRMIIHFMDNMIEINNYPLPIVKENVLRTRKIGMGVMGFAQMLYKLGIPYDSQEAADVADEVMAFIQKIARDESNKMAKQRGVFPGWKGSRWDVEDHLEVRNATMTTIAPTGTVSLAAGTSSGIEPVFSLAFKRRMFFEEGGNNQSSGEMMMIDSVFEQVAKDRGFYSEELMEQIAETGTIANMEEIPQDVRNVFRTTFDVSPEAHVRIQAAFQRHCDNAVSKTINFPNDATIDDVRRAYTMAYETGCKGVTIYRDGSKEGQVLSVGTAEKEKKEDPRSEQQKVVHIETNEVPEEEVAVIESFEAAVPATAEVSAVTKDTARVSAVTPDSKGLLTPNALQVLEKRALRKDDDGTVLEGPDELFARVARVIASADKEYTGFKKDLKKTEEQFESMLSNLEFIPGQALRNAGDKKLTNSACLVLPVEDSIESIMQTMKDNVLAHKATCGTGFNFSALRSKNAIVGSSGERASGPVAFMKAFNASQDTILTKGGRSQGSMAILNVWHPDIEEFIACKDDLEAMSHFNISVGITDDFMEALRNDEEFPLVDPHTKEVTKKIRAKELWDRLVKHAWTSGDPGLIFVDRLEATNPTPELGKLEATNPCGEQPLIPYETCNLGSIVLSRMLKEGSKGKKDIDWDKLKKTVKAATHFLDNTIDVSSFPIAKVRDMSRKTRRIGLGVMGFADMLVELGIPYNSDEAVKKAKEVMAFVNEAAQEASKDLGRKKGSFPAFDKSVHKKNRVKAMRNSAVTTIAPTGYTSIVAGCSSGIEPIFALAFRRENSMGGFKQIEVNAAFERVARERGFYSEELMEKVAEAGSCQNIDGVPQDVKDVFVTSYDINPEWDVKIQAAFQDHTDNAVSKTINFPNTATEEDIASVYLKSYELGCKGITIYRDGSKDQVLSVGTIEKKEEGEGVHPASPHAQPG
ncbi:MAG: adenosylcobalamin-dependent ribonucleoside-diphosphate reductase, partial [Candidatus Andersenbacteria bacterium]|nr:adenosylcobalamin-dependent ribonucleoside-diphosphate reductase [Candidatus Andersenbacteria bacterium]